MLKLLEIRLWVPEHKNDVLHTNIHLILFELFVFSL